MQRQTLINDFNKSSTLSPRKGIKKESVPIVSTILTLCIHYLYANCEFLVSTWFAFAFTEEYFCTRQRKNRCWKFWQAYSKFEMMVLLKWNAASEPQTLLLS